MPSTVLGNRPVVGAPRQGNTRAAATGLAVVATLALVAASLPGCRAKTRRTPDDTLVVLIPNLIRDLDPRFALTNYDVKLSRLVAVGLTTVDRANLEPALALAESIEAAGPLAFRVVLRPDARFSDGSPVRAEDVAFTFTSVMSPGLGSLKRRGFEERFERFEVLGERELVIHLVKPVATLMSDLDFGIISKSAADARMRYPDRRVVGAGPYMIETVSGERATLVRNPHFFGEAPRSPRIDFRVIRDSNATTLMLVGGSADLTQNSIRVDLVGEVAARDRIELVSGPSAFLTYLMMHNEDPILSDVRVRQAIALALDRRRIIEAKMGGRAVVATGMLPPSHWAYNGEVDRYDHDPERARKLLDEAGYPDPDGPGGRPRLRLSYKTSAEQFRLTLARIMAAQLAEVGIEVEVRSFEFGTFFADIKRGNYQLASMQTAEITEPDYLFTYFHSSRIPSPEELDLHNRWRYRNDRVDALTMKGREEMDRARRRELYAEAQAILAAEVPIVPLWHEDNLALMNVDVEGYQVFPNAQFIGLTTATKRAR
jgi:peptide/nickel transport system substrate-binding protein